MPESIVLVLNDLSKLEDVLAAWVALGVPGITTLHSTGLRQEMGKGLYRDDLPLFPALDDLLEGDEVQSRTLFTIIPDGFDVDALVAATERIIGDLAEPNTGILFTIPIGRVWGRSHQ